MFSKLYLFVFKSSLKIIVYFDLLLKLEFRNLEIIRELSNKLFLFFKGSCAHFLYIQKLWI